MLKIGRDGDRAISRQALVQLFATSRITVRIDEDYGIGLPLQDLSRRVKNRIGSSSDYRTIRIELQAV